MPRLLFIIGASKGGRRQWFRAWLAHLKRIWSHWPVVQGSCLPRRSWPRLARTRSLATWAHFQSSRGRAAAQASSHECQRKAHRRTHPDKRIRGEEGCRPNLSPIGTAMNRKHSISLDYRSLTLTRSCLTISKISVRLKSSVGFSLLFYLLHGNGSPSLPKGLNCSNESLMQSNRTLLCICSHSASKFWVGIAFWSSSTVMPFSAASFSLASLASSFLLAFLFFSKVRYSLSGNTWG